jgi:hypothetical protein
MRVWKWICRAWMWERGRWAMRWSDEVRNEVWIWARGRSQVLHWVDDHRSL